MSGEGKVLVVVGVVSWLVCGGIWDSCEESADAEKAAEEQAKQAAIDQQKQQKAREQKEKRQTERSAFEMEQIPELRELLKEVEAQIQAEEKGLKRLKEALVDLDRRPEEDEDYIKRQEHIALLGTEKSKIKNSMDDLWIDFVKMKTAPDQEKNQLLERHKKQAAVIASEVQEVLQEVKRNGL